MFNIYIYIYIYIYINNRTSCAQVNELPWGHWQIGNNLEGTLSVFLNTYIYSDICIFKILQNILKNYFQGIAFA